MKLGWLGGAALAAVTTLGGATTGCGPAARDVDDPQARRAAWKLRMDTADLHYLVWRGTVSDGETVWLDADGKEQARARGIVVAHRGRLWRLRPTSDLRQASGCNEDGSWDPAAQIEVRGDELFSGEEIYPLVDYYGESYGVRGGETTITLHGQLGRLMFVTQDEQLDGCDGVPRRRTAGFTYDLYHDDMSEALIDGESEESQRRAAGRQLAAAVRRAGGDPGSDPWAEVVDTRLAWVDGAPVLEHRFALPCDGCATDEPVTAWIAATVLPGIIADEGDLPEPVRRALTEASAAGATPVGVSWGLPDGRWQRVFEAR
jgi:hypothetical protein